MALVIISTTADIRARNYRFGVETVYKLPVFLFFPRLTMHVLGLRVLKSGGGISNEEVGSTLKVTTR
jgi:hypothetical protein